MNELRSAGFSALSVSDLRESGTNYRGGVPVLLRWLGDVSEPKLKEELVRALSVPWAKPDALAPMIDEFRRVNQAQDPTGLGLRWAIGNALNVLFDDVAYDTLAELATDVHFGRSREMIVLGLGRSKRPEVVNLLLMLMRDPDVDGHAVKALGRLKAPVARRALEAKLNDDRAWVRTAARKALARLPEL